MAEYLDELYNDCYKMYENNIKILEDKPETIVDQVDPQKLLDNMKEKSLTKVCSISKNYSSQKFPCPFETKHFSIFN